jgi:uncharacterized membrane protein
MVVALFASLALNLIVVGAVASFVWRHRLEFAAGPPPHLAPNLLGYTSTLPAERRKALWSHTEEERRNMRPFRRALREARDESLRALTAEPFDHQRYLAAQSRLLAADQQAREAVYKLYGEIAVSLTPDERRGFLRWREKRRPMQNLLDEPEKQAADPQQR